MKKTSDMFSKMNYICSQPGVPCDDLRRKIINCFFVGFYVQSAFLDNEVYITSIDQRVMKPSMYSFMKCRVPYVLFQKSRNSYMDDVVGIDEDIYLKKLPKPNLSEYLISDVADKDELEDCDSSDSKNFD